MHNYPAPVRDVLPNGLRVAMSPKESGSDVIGLTVVYDVGTRRDPVGRPGFAHLVEHLMFEGSGRVSAGAHLQYLRSVGAQANAITRPDLTYYYEVLPPGALELGLFLEADRMRGLAVDSVAIDRQVSRVGEEIEQHVDGVPFGGFPWRHLPQVLFRSYCNSHDSCRDAESLREVTPVEVQHFHHTYYAPGNAVLALSGAFDPAVALPLIEKHFGGIPSRPTPSPPNLSETWNRGDRQLVVTDKFADHQVVALGYRASDPTHKKDYAAEVLLAAILAREDTGRLAMRLNDSGLARNVRAYMGLLGDALETRDPDALVVELGLHQPCLRRVLHAIDEELTRLVHGDLSEREVRAERDAVVRDYERGNDYPIVLCRRMAAFELMGETAELACNWGSYVDAVDLVGVQEASRRLSRQDRSILLVRPGPE